MIGGIGSAQNVKVMQYDSLKVARCPRSALNVKVVSNSSKREVNGGSVNDSLKVTSSECQSNGNLKQAWVHGGRGHDSQNSQRSDFSK